MPQVIGVVRIIADGANANKFAFGYLLSKVLFLAINTCWKPTRATTPTGSLSLVKCI